MNYRQYKKYLKKSFSWYDLDNILYTKAYFKELKKESKKRNKSIVEMLESN